MWPSDPIRIDVCRNTQTPVGLQFWDDIANEPLDVTGYSFSCLVGFSEGSGVIVSFFCEVLDYANGMIDIVFNGPALSGVPGSKEQVSLTYQVIATDDQGNSVTAMRGPLVLTPGVK